MCAALSTRQRPAGSFFGSPCLLQQCLALHVPRPEQRRRHNRATSTATRTSAAAPLWHELFKYDVDGDGKLTYAEVQLLLADLHLSPPTAASPATAAPAAPATVTSEPVKPAGPPKPLSYELQALHGLQDCRRQGRSWVAALIAYATTKLTNQHKSRAKASDLVWSALGMFVGVAALGTVALGVKAWPAVGHWHQQGLGLLLGSFGTLCVLIFGRPDAEPIRLWNLVVGHAVSIAVVMALVHTLKPGVVVRALAMAAMIAAMLWTDSVHPPGGALVLMTVDSPVIQSMGPWFLLYPSLFFCFGLLLPIGCATNWLKRNVQFDFPAAAPTPSAAAAASRTAGTAGAGDLKLKAA